jgi:protein-tyrosine phosphatase
VPPPDSAIASLPNLRDVGGHTTADGGRVRTGLLFRSMDLGRVDADGAEALARLGLRAVFDLRTVAERDAAPDRVPSGAAYVTLDVLGDAPGSGPEALKGMLSDPADAERILGGGRAEHFFEDRYREFVNLPSAQAAFGSLLRSLADEAYRPALFHCTTGKDRTGWAAATLLLLLGVPHSDVMADYLESNGHVLPAFAPIVETFAARGGDPALLWPLLEVRPAYLRAGLDEVDRRYGSMERYADEGLGLDAGARAALRAALVAD